MSKNTNLSPAETTLPALEFHLASIDGSPERTVLVLLENFHLARPSQETIDALEDSIASYIETAPEWELEDLIHDVLSAEEIDYRIIDIVHTFDI